MDKAEILQRAHGFCAPFRVADGAAFRLAAIDPANTLDLDPTAKEPAAQVLREGVEILAELQNRLYARDRWALLLIFQAMDAAGKDSTIKHVMSGVNPQGCQVTSFKAPTTTELDHDYLWRCNLALPDRGRIGIFNRSYYEEVLAVRVHPEFLARQGLPDAVVSKSIWKERHEDIAAYERYLTRNGIAIRKFFLHVSREEQRRRFLERIDDPDKNWKFSARDVAEREHWDAYMDAFEDAIRATATPHAPWFVVPADSKWFTRTVVAAAIVELMESLGLAYPVLTAGQRGELLAIRNQLDPDGQRPHP